MKEQDEEFTDPILDKLLAKITPEMQRRTTLQMLGEIVEHQAEKLNMEPIDFLKVSAKGFVSKEHAFKCPSKEEMEKVLREIMSMYLTLTETEHGYHIEKHRAIERIVSWFQEYQTTEL